MKKYLEGQSMHDTKNKKFSMLGMENGFIYS